MNIDEAKSYATEKNLDKALKELGLDGYRFLVVCTRTGRFTAVFVASSLGGNMTVAARHGFLTVG